METVARDWNFGGVSWYADRYSVLGEEKMVGESPPIADALAERDHMSWFVRMGTGLRYSAEWLVFTFGGDGHGLRIGGGELAMREDGIGMW